VSFAGPNERSPEPQRAGGPRQANTESDMKSRAAVAKGAVLNIVKVEPGATVGGFGLGGIGLSVVQGAATGASLGQPSEPGRRSPRRRARWWSGGG
jgi:hypothetical protein